MLVVVQFNTVVDGALIAAVAAAGWTFMVALVAVDTHPLFCTVTL